MKGQPDAGDRRAVAAGYLVDGNIPVCDHSDKHRPFVFFGRQIQFDRLHAAVQAFVGVRLSALQKAALDDLDARRLQVLDDRRHTLPAEGKVVDISAVT